MKITDVSWDEFAPFLRKARGQAVNSVLNHKSRFFTLQKWFRDKDFNTKTFSIFLDQAEKEGKSPSYQNNCLKLAKHIAFYLNESSEFEGFKYVDEKGHSPDNILTRQQIISLAKVKIIYLRFKNRGIKIPTLIHFLGNVGSRIDETLKLEWRDVIEDETPMIRFREEITKTGRERFCPIPKWLHKLLVSLPRDNQFIFGKIEDSNFREDLEKRRLLLKIPFKVTCHTFRDSSINNKLESGISLEEVAHYHGHVKIDTTYRFYVRIQAKRLANSLRQLDPAFREDQTFDTAIKIIKENLEKLINPDLMDSIWKNLNNSKRVHILELIEK